MIKKWETLEERRAADLKIFDAFWYKRRRPGWEKTGEYVVLKSPLWVNIIPMTSDGKVVFVEQYRHGIDEMTLEVPGGLVEKGEDPRAAAERECAEETGFASDEEALLIGETQPNPAFLDNICYSYLWKNCEKKFEQRLDGSEDIDVKLFDIDEIKRMIADKKIQHSLVLNAFFYYFLKFGD